MKVRFHGVRGSTPCHGEEIRRYGGNTSCVSIDVPGERPIILDLGTGVRYLGLEHPQGPFSANCLLSHLHWDHIQGLPFFGPVLRDGSRLDVWAPRQGDGRSVGETMASIIRPPMFPVTLEQLPGDIVFHDLEEGSFGLGAVEVSARSVPHIGPTFGYRITWQGRSVAYLSDHQEPLDGAPCAPGVLELCAGVDVLIHDSQYTDADFPSHRDWGHCRVGFAVELARRCEVGTLVLFHHDPSRDDDALDRVGADAAEALAPDGVTVVTAFEGLTLDVGD
jgi:phosphoribosyl 1,2-cyclic phosphodiesterase